MSYKFLVKSVIEINYLDSFFYNSHFNFVFEQPTYWQAISAIIKGELYIAYLKDFEENIKSWIPFILRREKNIKLVNALPYFGSHGGPYGPSTNLYNDLLCKFFEYCNSNNIDSTFIALSLEASEGLNDKIKSKYYIDERIGQVSDIPIYSPNIEKDLFDHYHVKTRNAIRKANKVENISLVINPELDLFKKIIDLHIKNITALGGIPKDLDHFNLLKSFSGKGYTFRVATYLINNEIACALISLITSKTFEYFTPVLNPNYRSSQLLSRLIHNELIYASFLKLKYWNWGGTWPSQEGVYRFKSRWGARSFPYYYLMSQKNEKVRSSCEKGEAKFDYMYKYKF